MVITIEPGLYIKEKALGVRIEDDVLVTTLVATRRGSPSLEIGGVPGHSHEAEGVALPLAGLG